MLVREGFKLVLTGPVADSTVADLDFLMKSLMTAREATENEDVVARRAAVKIAFDLILSLQGRDSEIAEAYFFLFTEVLQASHEASVAKFDSAISRLADIRQTHYHLPRFTERFQDLAVSR